MAQLNQPSFDPISITATLQTVFNNLGSLLQQIPLVGNWFKGSTPHIDEDTAVAKSNELATNFMKLFNTTDQTDQEYIGARVKEFYDSRFQAFAGWWGDIFQVDFESWNAKGWTSSLSQLTYHRVAQPAFIFLRFEDATRVGETFPTRYTNPFNTMVMNPVRDYIQNKYHVTIEQYQFQHPNVPAESGVGSALKSLPSWTWIAVGIALFFGYKHFKKG